MLNVTATKNKTIFVIMDVFIHEDNLVKWKCQHEESVIAILSVHNLSNIKYFVKSLISCIYLFLVLTLLSHWFVLSL